MPDVTIPCPKCHGKGNDFESVNPAPEKVLVCKHCGHEIGTYTDIKETIMEGARRTAREAFEASRQKR